MYYLVAQIDALGAINPADTANTVASRPIAVGIATHLGFLQQPTNSQTHGLVAPVTVAIEDANNEVVASDDSTVTIAVDFGSNTLKTLSAQAVDGVATFNTLSIGSSKVYTLEASDGGLTPSQSVSFTVAPGPLANLSFQQQPSAAIAGIAISPAVTVKATDNLGNFIDNAPITLEVAGGPGLLTGTVTAMTNSAGIAVFGNLLLVTPGGYTLVAKDGTVTSAASNAFTVSALAPQAVSAKFMGIVPSTAKPGAVILPVLQFTDATGAASVVNRKESIIYYLATTPSGHRATRLLSRTYILNLKGGKTQSEAQRMTLPAGLASGTYYVIAEIDSTGAINPDDRSHFAVSGPIAVSTATHPGVK